MDIRIKKIYKDIPHPTEYGYYLVLICDSGLKLLSLLEDYRFVEELTPKFRSDNNLSSAYGLFIKRRD